MDLNDEVGAVLDRTRVGDSARVLVVHKDRRKISVKVTVDNAVAIVRSDNMQIGDIGLIIDSGARNGTVLLRTFSGYVSLNNPRKTWYSPQGESSYDPKFDVQLLPKGTRVILEVE